MLILHFKWIILICFKNKLIKLLNLQNDDF